MRIGANRGSIPHQPELPQYPVSAVVRRRTDLVPQQNIFDKKTTKYFQNVAPCDGAPALTKNLIDTLN